MTAIDFADGPLRKYMETEEVFARFCRTIGTFRELFQAHPSLENNDAGQAHDSLVIPDFVKEYLQAGLWLVCTPSSNSHLFILTCE